MTVCGNIHEKTEISKTPLAQKFRYEELTLAYVQVEDKVK
jgi:hypothetical protein